MTRRIFLILTLIAVAAVILFARRDRPDELPSTARAGQQPQPGYFMTDASVVQTGPDGLPMYRMHADRIQQNPADLTVRLENLRLNYRVATSRALAREWTLTAKQGDMPQAATRIELAGDVEILGLPQVGAAGTPPATIRTSKLSVDMKANRVSTAEPVEIAWGEQRRLTAKGLQVDLKAQTVKLESKINAHLVP